MNTPIAKLKAALELASHRADMWEEMARTGELQLSEFHESDQDELENMDALTASIVKDAYAVLESTPKHSEHFGQRYCHPNVMDEAMIHNAMDIWEAVILSNNESGMYEWFTQEDGRNEGVDIAMTMAPRFEQAWDQIKDRFTDRAFDFEFVPRLLEMMQEYGEQFNQPVYEIPQEAINAMAEAIVLEKS